MKKLVLTFLLIIAAVAQATSQCAMCRATIENNVANGEIGIGAGLNFGILYLFVMPYLAVMVIGYLWYKNSKANAKKQGRRYIRS
ncbi:MAG: hypothetical protein P8X57_10585 [Cyclobacteriaceae bacterium]